MEEALKKAMDSTEVRLHLQPLQGSLKRKAESVVDDDKKQKGSSEVNKMQKSIENLQGQIKNLRNATHGVTNNPGGKGKKAKERTKGIRFGC